MKGMYKRLLVLLITAMMLVTVFATSAFAAETEEQEIYCYLHGDVDSNGELTSDDAVYTLYYSFGFGNYVANQACDFNNDGIIDSDDAVWLLFAQYEFPGYELQGQVHEWFDPAWTWAQTGEGYSASVTLKCACGQPVLYTAQVEEDESAYQAPDCVTPGKRVYVATVTDAEGNVLATDTYTEELPTGGHVLSGGQGCEDPIYCENCDYEQAARGHVMKPQGEPTEGNCKTESVQQYKCENCTHTEEVKLGLGQCTFAYLEARLEEGETCKWVKWYKCSGCGKEQAGTDTENDYYTVHSYTAEQTQDPTCQTAGKKVYTCSDCGDHYDEAVAAVPGAHVWVNNECTVCHEKTVVVAKDEAVGTEVLKESGLKLDGGVTMAMDSTAADSLEAEREIVVSVEPVATTDLSSLVEAEKTNVRRQDTR